jgi:hypothetical protein
VAFPRRFTVPIGFAVVAFGAYLTVFPEVTANVLDRPHDSPTQWINLRASFGGTLLGIGAFIAWLPAVKPYLRAFLGLLGWAMAGIGAARLVGFVVDGSPDTRQWIWIVAEVLIAAACAIILRRRRALG